MTTAETQITVGRKATAARSTLAGKKNAGKAKKSAKMSKGRVAHAEGKIMRKPADPTTLSPDEITERVTAWLANGGQQRFEAAMEEAIRNGERFIRATRVRQETLTEPVTL